MGGRWLAAAAVVLIAGTGCSLPTPPSTPPGSAPAGNPTAVQLVVGDCTGPVDLTGATMAGPSRVDCGQPHHYEVHATVELSGDGYPGPAALAEQARAVCTTSFIDYVGVDPEYSRYSSAYLVPDQPAWSHPDQRRITCLAGSAEGGLTGSARGDVLLFPRKGECTGPQDVPAVAVQRIDCGQPHHYEVFAAKQFSGQEAPSKKEIDQAFNTVCLAGFKKLVGLDAGKSAYEVTYFLARAELWTRIADHRMVCSAGSPKGGITGSLKGVRK